MNKLPFSVNHDIHCHSTLSACCFEEACTPQAICDQLHDKGYDTVCITNHMWDSDVPGASEWYALQTIEHVLSGLPIPKYDDMRTLWGCEIDYAGGNLALRRDHFDLFDFVVIPPNHMHMIDFVRPASITTAEQVADFFMQRMEEISKMDLPFEKIGIAHMTTTLMFRGGNVLDVLHLIDEKRMMPVFDRLAKGGAGIELNARAFMHFDKDPEAYVHIYSMAKKAGCKFYCASDSHKLSDFSKNEETLPKIVSALGLTAEDRYIIPER